jgi:hypothetical protein
MENSDILALITAGRAHPLGAKLSGNRFLAAVAMAVKELTSDTVLVPRRRIRNDRDKLAMSDGAHLYTTSVYYLMQVGEALFDEHGPTSWEQQELQHNQTQQSPVQWDGEPMNGGEHFHDIFQGAGSYISAMFELKDHLLAVGQAQLLQQVTPTPEKATPSRRM